MRCIVAVVVRVTIHSRIPVQVPQLSRIDYLNVVKRRCFLAMVLKLKLHVQKAILGGPLYFGLTDGLSYFELAIVAPDCGD